MDEILEKDSSGKNINFVEEFRNFRAIATLCAALLFLHQIIL
jgi:hypothetical protein